MQITLTFGPEDLLDAYDDLTEEEAEEFFSLYYNDLSELITSSAWGHIETLLDMYRPDRD